MKSLRLIFKLARPHFLLGGILLYALGVGIARYLGTPVDWGIYFLGQAWVTLMQLSTQFLNEYFDAEADAHNTNRTPFTGGSGAIGEDKLPRAVAFWSGMICLAGVALLTFFVIKDIRPSAETYLFMSLIFLGAFFYAMPPVKLESSGFGELTTSIVVANLVPALGFLFQAGGLHRLLAMTTFPLTGLHLAMLLAFELPDFATDIKYDKRTMLVRLGWQTGMNLHNLLILASFLMLAIAATLGLPVRIALPAFLALPLGLLQIWYMNRIAAGAKPNWNVLTLSALVLFGATAYLLALTFWLR